MFYTYVAKQEKKKLYYIGHTSNLEMQLKKYNDPESVSLRHKPAVYIVHYEAFSSENEAQKREKEIKNSKTKFCEALSLKR
jgi:putative endonuclease